MDEYPMESANVDLKKTLHLPKTDFPMKASLGQLEPKLLEGWNRIGLYERIREARKGRPTYILHDGPPYANGNIHLGHALNKLLKDFIVKIKTMEGYDSPYVPGWDCHGLPIEIKVEGELGSKKAKMTAAEIRAACRKYAEKYVDLQRKDFIRLGVLGRWADPYLTMSAEYEAVIAQAFVDFVDQGYVYKGLKPVNWCIRDRTALAEAEVEYENHSSPSIWVRFALQTDPAEIDETLKGKKVWGLIWTTTPWTIPANRAISYSGRFPYGLYEVTKAPEGNWAAVGEKYILADKLAAVTLAKAKVEEFIRLSDVDLAKVVSCNHPLRGLAGGYQFEVALLEGEHVTDDAGTGFVHTAPSHGLDDFDIWLKSTRKLQALGIDTAIPYTVDDAGFFTADAPGFEGGRVLDDSGKKGDANQRVITALAD